MKNLVNMQFIKNNIINSLTISFLAILCLTSCGGGGGSSSPNHSIGCFEITGESNLAIGGSEQFTINPQQTSGDTPQPIRINFTFSNPGVAEITDNTCESGINRVGICTILVKGIKAGNTTLTISARGLKSATQPISVAQRWGRLLGGVKNLGASAPMVNDNGKIYVLASTYPQEMNSTVYVSDNGRPWKLVGGYLRRDKEWEIGVLFNSSSTLCVPLAKFYDVEYSPSIVKCSFNGTPWQQIGDPVDITVTHGSIHNNQLYIAGFTAFLYKEYVCDINNCHFTQVGNYIPLCNEYDNDVPCNITGLDESTLYVTNSLGNKIYYRDSNGNFQLYGNITKQEPYPTSLVTFKDKNGGLYAYPQSYPPNNIWPNHVYYSSGISNNFNAIGGTIAGNNSEYFSFVYSYGNKIYASSYDKMIYENTGSSWKPVGIDSAPFRAGNHPMNVFIYNNTLYALTHGESTEISDNIYVYSLNP